jgi:predicted TIM-barrel fold metal-dependent hydrolase
MEAALLEIERCDKAGARGIGEMRPDAQLFNLLDDEVTGPFVKMMRRQKLSLMIHSSEPMGHSYPGKGSVTPDLLFTFISSYPDLTVICSHWGGGLPFYALMPEVKKVLKNVYFDTAATSLLYDTQIFKTVIDLVGAEKVLYGSDFPLIEQGKSVKDIVSLGLADEADILGDNAASLLGIKG